MNSRISDTLQPGTEVNEERPWLGLRSFTEDVSQYFFGRDKEIPDLADRIRQRPLTILYGQSGLGKTSLLNAGVIPRLRQEGYEPVLMRIIYDPRLQPLSPEQQVLHEFALRFPNAPQPATTALTLWDLFHDPQFGFAGTPPAADKTTVNCSPHSLPRPVLLLDQFEELFTLGLTLREKETRAFFEALSCVVENRAGALARARLEDDDYADRVLQHVRPCRVVFSMRDDYLHQLERLRRQMPSMMDNRCELRRLTGRQAFDAAFNPGLRRRDAGKGPPILSVQTAEQIVRLAAGKEADVPLEEIENVPPLLSLMCEQLNNRRLREKQETIESANIQGSADEVLRDFCRDSFRGCHPALREFVEQRLVSGSGIRQSVNLETAETELQTAGVPQADQALRRLVDRRLLTVEDRGGISRLELTHDILAPVIVRSRRSGTSEAALQAATNVYLKLGDGDDCRQSTDQRLAERLFRSLAQPGPAGEFVRRQPALTLAALADEIGAEPARTVMVAEKFAAEQGLLVLLPAGGPATPLATADVEHRSLFSDWKLASNWIAQEAHDAEDFRTLLNLQRNGTKVLDDESLARYEKFFERVQPTPAWARRYQPGAVSGQQAAQCLQDCRQLVDDSRNFRRRLKLRRRLYIAVAVVVLMAGAWLWLSDRQRQNSLNVTQKYLATPAAFLNELTEHQQVALPILLQKFETADPDHPEWQLHAAWGLARLQPTEPLLQWLSSQVPKLSAEQFRGTAQALEDVLRQLQLPPGEFVQQQLNASGDNRKTELRWLLMGLELGETQRLDRYCKPKPDPSDTTQLMLDLPTVPIDVVWINQILEPGKTALAPDTRHLLCLVVGGLQGNGVAAEKSLVEVFKNAQDPGSHAAARWALQQLGYSFESLENLIADRSETDARDWYVTPRLGATGKQVPGFTMVQVPKHPEFVLGNVKDDKNPPDEDWREWQPEDHEPVDSFWLSDREVSRRQVRALLDDGATWAEQQPRWQKLRSQLREIYNAGMGQSSQNNSLDQPITASWYNAVALCNLLSIYEGLDPAYSFSVDAFVVMSDSLQLQRETGVTKSDSLQLQSQTGIAQLTVNSTSGNGYRLPSEREWEYACRALSMSKFVFGNRDDWLDLYDIWKDRPLVSGGSLRPNRWGLFDMHGSLWEWGGDTFDREELMGPEQEVKAWLESQLQADQPSGVLRGGSFYNSNPDSLRSAHRNEDSRGNRVNLNGFRISRRK